MRWHLRRRSPRTRSAVPAWRNEVFERFSAASELPMLLLSVVMIPVILIPLINHHLSAGASNALKAADYLIWAIFLIEYLIKVVLAPRRLSFIVRNVPELVVVAVPVLRPLRLLRSARTLRLLRLTRLSAFAGETGTKSKRTLHSRALLYTLVITGLLLLVTSAVVYDLERTAHNANIKTFSDALWWSVTTVTTVGYGDRFPITPGGRAVAVVLMLTGIALLGVITAALAAFFVQSLHGISPGAVTAPGGTRQASQDDLHERLTRIERTLDSLVLALNEAAASRNSPTDPAHNFAVAPGGHDAPPAAAAPSAPPTRQPRN